jgi:SMC interacting uncharacterized protein involved in chromosome segregation
LPGAFHCWCPVHWLQWFTRTLSAIYNKHSWTAFMSSLSWYVLLSLQICLLIMLRILEWNLKLL